MRVLIVDDEQLVAMTVARVMRAEQVTIETHAQAAVDGVARGEVYDLVICDVMMPELDGREVVARIQALHDQHGAARPALVLMSGYDDLGGIPEGVSILVKPFSPADLRAIVADVLPQRQAG